MFDRETRTLWSHVTGKAVQGPLAGTRLNMLPAVHTTWALWRANHPDTIVLEKRGPSRANPHLLESSYVLRLVANGEAVGFPLRAARSSRSTSIKRPRRSRSGAGVPFLLARAFPKGTIWRAP